MSTEEVTLFKHNPLNRITRKSQPFRLLEIQPSSEPSSQIECTLHHANLLAKPEFKALSYVWGDPDLKVPILLDSKRYDVTKNCYSALLLLRELGEKSVWIDAICIDQTNNDEKASQIPKMEDIYAAVETIVWLGHAREERRQDAQQAESMAFALLDELSGEVYHKIDQFIELAHREDFSPLHWNAVNDLLNHNWFKRLWTHQEFILAKSATLVTDYNSMTLTKFLTAIRNLGNATDQIPAKNLPDFLVEIFKDYAVMMGLRRARMRALARTNRNPLHLPYQKISFLHQDDVGEDTIALTTAIECMQY